MQAFLVSIVTYAVHYYPLHYVDKKKPNSVIRAAYRTAHDLPKFAKTDRLIQLGISSTIEELVAAQIEQHK